MNYQTITNEQIEQAKRAKIRQLEEEHLSLSIERDICAAQVDGPDGADRLAKILNRLSQIETSLQSLG